MNRLVTHTCGRPMGPEDITDLGRINPSKFTITDDTVFLRGGKPVQPPRISCIVETLDDLIDEGQFSDAEHSLSSYARITCKVVHLSSTAEVEGFKATHVQHCRCAPGECEQQGIWDDMIAFYQLREAGATITWLHDLGYYKGRPTLRWLAIVYATCIPMLTPASRQWLLALLADQPVVQVQVPELTRQQLRDFDDYHEGDDIHAVRFLLEDCFRNKNHFETYQTVAILGAITQTVAELAMLGGRPTPPPQGQVAAHYNLLGLFAIEVSSTASLWHPIVRRRFAETPSPYTFWLRALMDQAKKIRYNNPHKKISWLLRKHVLQAIEGAPFGSVEYLEEQRARVQQLSNVLRYDLHWHTSWPLQEDVVSNYNPFSELNGQLLRPMQLPRWHNSRMQQAPETLEPRESRHELAPNEDVEFRAVGRRLDVAEYAAAVLFPKDPQCTICLLDNTPPFRHRELKEMIMQLQCGHCFHYNCLDDLINEVHRTSNLCPNCRHKICEPRKREPIGVDDE
ncbi:hypothetical protein M011DRAFT_210321 [Sporormia fimetaria CBS 119925]|uniref:RING-type domain-containing protein n=1 Tax=Sporormia fimetaria CBS 119925 TaxID=1340428 RepID=A0A6A6UZN9_9PLEO|nr:hypothetical protein M011DRAFT_210321 [Sporormia fimetaria CBS 119925]